MAGEVSEVQSILLAGPQMSGKPVGVSGVS